MTAPEHEDDRPEFATGGLVQGPDGGDSIPAFLRQGEQFYTAEQVRRFMAAKPGSHDAFGPASPIAPVPVDEAELTAMPERRWWQYHVCGIGRADLLQGEPRD